MRRRQIKKFAKCLPDLTAYREAWRGGSKRLVRRKRAFAKFRNRSGVPHSLERVQAEAQLVESRARVRALLAELKSRRASFERVMSERINAATLPASMRPIS